MIINDIIMISKQITTLYDITLRPSFDGPTEMEEKS